jgi:hypothetical protein
MVTAAQGMALSAVFEPADNELKNSGAAKPAAAHALIFDRSPVRYRC